MSADKEIENQKKILGFLKKNLDSEYFANEIAQETGLPENEVSAIIDNARLNQWVDVEHLDDKGKPAVKINLFGNKKLNQLTGESSSLPSKNTGSTIIAGRDVIISDKINSDNKIDSDNIVNSNNKSSDRSKLVKIGIIISILGSLVTVIWFVWAVTQSNDMSQNDNMILTTIVENVTSEKKNSIEHQRIISSFDKGRPFSVVWTGCDLAGPDTNEDIGDYKFFMFLKILDVDEKEALIPFNTNFRFSASTTIQNSTIIEDLGSITIELHQINPNKSESIVIDLTKILNEALDHNAITVLLNLEETSIAPYSDVTEENVAEYSRNVIDQTAAKFIYLPGYFDKWVEPTSYPKEFICGNLYSK